MGEYARDIMTGEEVKIGTCENMYYLRFDQRAQVAEVPNSLDPNDPEVVYALRWRFPWPDEDATARPGYDNERHEYDRGQPIPGAKHPAGVEHGSVQFKAHPGYLVSLPCPEGPDAAWLRLHKGENPLPVAIHRNGVGGAVELCQQKLLRDGRIVPILRCVGCGTRYRLEDAAEIEALVVGIRSQVDAWTAYDPTDARIRYWSTIADRIAEGAQIAAEVSA